MITRYVGMKYKDLMPFPDNNDPEYFSNAEWSKIGKSKDGPQTFDFANVICMRLLDAYGLYGVCDIRGECLNAWVSDKDGNVIRKWNRITGKE